MNSERFRPGETAREHAARLQDQRNVHLHEPKRKTRMNFRLAGIWKWAHGRTGMAFFDPDEEKGEVEDETTQVTDGD